MNIQKLPKCVSLTSIFIFIVFSGLSIAGDNEQYLGEGGAVSSSGAQVSTFDYPSLILDNKHETPEDIPQLQYEFDQASFDKIKELSNKSKVSSEGMALEDTSGEQQDPSLSLYLFNNFAGPTYTGWIPPDPVLAVGPEHIIVCVNSSWTIYNKSGTQLYATTFSNWFSNVNPPGSPFDPKVIYDHHEERWIILAVAKDAVSQSSYMITVSDDENPLGSWWNWNLDATVNGSTPTSNWADYPGLGFDYSGAVYITSNQYAFGGGFQYAKIRILQKSQLYSWASLSWYDYWGMQNSDATTVFTIKPAEVMTYPSGTYLLNTRSGGDNYVTVWRLLNPVISPSLTRAATVSVGNYVVPPNADQPGSSIDIETNDCRTQDLVYRMNTLYTAFTAGYNWGSGTRAAIKYLKISTMDYSTLRNTFYGASTRDYYYPKTTPSSSGDCETIVFNRSNDTEYASIRYVLDFDNNSSSSQLKAGEGWYVNLDGNNRNRWGDYNGIWFDPSNQSIWLFSEYATTNSSQWATWIGQVSCVGYQYLPADMSMYYYAWPPQVQGGDVTYYVNFMRMYASSIPCYFDGSLGNFWASADVNGSCAVDGADLSTLVSVMRNILLPMYCDQYPTIWPTPLDLPPSAPAGWPNCDNSPVTSGRIIPSDGVK